MDGVFCVDFIVYFCYVDVGIDDFVGIWVVGNFCYVIVQYDVEVGSNECLFFVEFEGYVGIDVLLEQVVVFIEYVFLVGDVVGIEWIDV